MSITSKAIGGLIIKGYLGKPGTHSSTYLYVDHGNSVTYVSREAIPRGKHKSVKKLLYKLIQYTWFWSNLFIVYIFLPNPDPNGIIHM